MSRTPRVSRRACRVFRVCSCLTFAACVVACMSAPFKARAVYGPGLEFRAIADRDAFDEMTWSDFDLRQPVCPVVVHLPGGDITDAQFQSAKALAGLGGAEQSHDVGKGNEKLRVTIATLTRASAALTAHYHDDRIVSLTIRVSGPTALTVRGTRVTLPLTKAEMVGAFGEPKQMIE